MEISSRIGSFITLIGTQVSHKSLYVFRVSYFVQSTGVK